MATDSLITGEINKDWKMAYESSQGMMRELIEEVGQIREALHPGVADEDISVLDLARKRYTQLVDALSEQMENALASAPDKFEKLPDGKWQLRK